MPVKHEMRAMNGKICSEIGEGREEPGSEVWRHGH